MILHYVKYSLLRFLSLLLFFKLGFKATKLSQFISSVHIIREAFWWYMPINSHAIVLKISEASWGETKG